jgi:hypothetical protein
MLVTSDLDRTLIYSRAAAGKAFDGADPVCVESYDGAPLSYLTPAARDGLQRLTGIAVFVPTTTRSPAQYHRIALPGPPPRYAICSNGGEVLVDGEPDLGWQQRIRGTLAELPAGLTEILAACRAWLDPAWEPRLREVPGLFGYVVSERRIPASAVERWRRTCDPLGWSVSQQGRKLYTIPAPLTKSGAAAEVRRRLLAEGRLAADAPWAAAGDGALDADLLRAADLAIRPAHGELHELDLRFPGLTVTDGVGLAAGEQIVEWFLAQATARSGSPVTVDMSANARLCRTPPPQRQE